MKRGPSKRTRRAFVCGAWVLASSAFGCNAPTQQSAPHDEEEAASGTERRVAVGGLATNPYFSIRVLNSKVCTLAPHLAPPPGIKKLAVELELHGLGATEVPANPLYATLIDDKDQRYESTAQGCRPMLAAPALVKGATTRGWVTFDVPESSIAKEIAYQPALVGARSPRAALEVR